MYSNQNSYDHKKNEETMSYGMHNTTHENQQPNQNNSLLENTLNSLDSSKALKVFGSSKFGKHAGKLVQQGMKDLGPVEAACYSLCACIVVLGYHMFSDGVFSSLITLASVIQFLGFVLTLVKVEKEKSFGSLSIKSMELYVPIYILRLMCTLFHEGYLPADSSGDWAYQIADICALATVSYLLYKAKFTPLSSTVKEEKYFPSTIVFAFSFALACVMFPRHNLGIWADTFWTGSLYLETFVMIPQVRLIAAGESVENLTSHSIACTFIYRFINCYFWIVCRLELVRERDQDHVPGYFVVGALCIQVVLLSDFIYLYGKSLVNNKNFALPMFVGGYSNAV